MFKKLRKPAPASTPPPTQETDAILSKIDASVNQRREGDRGRARDRVGSTGLQQQIPQKGYPANVYARGRTTSDYTGQIPAHVPPQQYYHDPRMQQQPQVVYQQHQQQQMYQQQQQPAYQQQQPMQMFYQQPAQPLPPTPEKSISRSPVPSPSDPYKPAPLPKSPIATTSATNTTPATPTSRPSTPKDTARQSLRPVYRPAKTDDDELKASASLSEHLFQYAFIDGSFSDTTMFILGKTYNLHKVVLCRFLFFQKMFTADPDSPIVKTKDIEIAVDDKNVTSEAVDVVLASMYGLVCPVVYRDKPEFLAITPHNVLAVLATAIFFQHKKLIDYTMDFIKLHELAPQQYRALALDRFPDIGEVRFPTPHDVVLKYIQLIDGPDYGAISESLEDALLNYLCFEGYKNLESLFVELPLAWLERVLEADAFWCPNEFSRYQFAKTVILNRRMKELKVDEVPSEDGQRTSEQVYSDIFRYAIIYTHMTLNEVKSDNFVAENILMKSLWHQTRFRSTIESMSEATVSLGKPEEKDETQTNSMAVPVRLGVEFKDLITVEEGARNYSSTFFYGGSWWSIFLQRFPATVDDNGQQKPEKWGLFLRRSEGAELMKIAQSTGPATEQSIYQPDIIIDPLTGAEIEKSVSYYLDKRVTTRVVFKLFNPAIKSYDPIFESRPNDFAETQSWGFRSRDQVVGDLDSRLSNQKLAFNVRLAIVMKFI